MYQTEIPVVRRLPASDAASRMSRHGGDVPVIDVPALLATLWRRRTWIIRTLAITVLATAAIVATRPQTFTATTRILIDPRGLYVVEKDLNANGKSGNADTAHVENQMRVLTSDKVLARVVETEGLVDDIEFGARPGNILSLPFALLRMVLHGKPDAADPNLEALRHLREAVSTDRPQGSYVVDLYVSTRMPQKSARIANAIATAYVESELGVRNDAAQRVSENLAQRAEELRKRVREAEQKVEEYRQANGLVGIGATERTGADGRLLSQEQLAQMNQQVSLARARVSQAKARVDQIEGLRAEGAGYSAFADALQSQTITQLRTRYSAAREIEASLATTLGPRHPRLAAARAQVQDIEGTIDEEVARIARSAHGDLSRAQADEAELVARLEALKKESAITDNAQVRLRELEREANASRVVYESFLMRSREISEQKGLDTSSDRVLSPAVAPVDADGPRRLFLLAFAAVFALGLGSVMALVREQFDDRLNEPGRASALTGLPVLVSVPDLSVDAPATPGAGLQSLLFSEALPAVVFHDRTSEGAAAFRRLDAMLRERPDKISLRTILVTTPGPTGGKSTVALNMALAAAETGDRVLLADGDTVEHNLSTVAGLPATDAACATHSVISGKGPGLDFATPASLGLDRQDTVDARKVRSAIVHLAGDYDTIIIDGSAIGSAASLTAIADAASDLVMVVRAGTTRGSVLAQAVASLGPAGRKIRGCVFLEV